VFLSVLGYGTLAGAATIIGTLLILYKYDWAKHNSIHLMSFAAGLMLAVAFLHLIPEAVEMGHEGEVHLEVAEHEGEVHAEESEHNGGGTFIFLMVLLSFVTFHAIESIMSLHPRHDVEDEEPHKHGHLSILSITGLTFHSLIDGIVIAVGFKAGSRIGIMMTIAVILHEMPEGVVTTSVLLHDTMSRVKIFWFSLLVAAATPVGAVASYFILSEASENVLRILLALAAGSFIYVAAVDLIPETHREEKRFNTVILIAGMAVLYFIGRLMTHGH
jgi:zinc and cadmium transporter